MIDFEKIVVFFQHICSRGSLHLLDAGRQSLHIRIEPIANQTERANAIIGADGHNVRKVTNAV